MCRLAEANEQVARSSADDLLPVSQQERRLVHMMSRQSVGNDPELAREWFLNHMATIRVGIEDLAGRLEVGLDELSAPYIKSWAEPAEGVTFRLRCSAIRRLSGLEIASHLREVASQLDRDVTSLPRADLMAV